MANDESLKAIKQGPKAWSSWRIERQMARFRSSDPCVQADHSELDLSDADLTGMDLSEASLGEVNLVRADLHKTNLSRAYLYGADLTGAHLRGVNLTWADLRKVTLREAYLFGADLRNADFSGACFKNADLSEADLRDANLTNADLSGVGMNGADLRGANFSGANLSGAVLVNADLSGANLKDSNLVQADLVEVNLREAELTGANMAQALLRGTIFSNNDLSAANGLENVRHLGPSTIGIDTLFRSDGRIPEEFLRGAGVPEDFITFVPSLVGRAIEFYSCFISYSHNDQEFSQRLHSRMRSENLRVWYAPEDMKGGRKLHEEIFRAIQIHDKLLLVLSESSMKSEWVITEIRRAKRVEREENRRKLFPIRLVDFDTIQKWECFDADSGKDLAAEVREYYIPDFSHWKDHDSFESEFGKLLRDLRADQD